MHTSWRNAGRRGVVEVHRGKHEVVNLRPPVHRRFPFIAGVGVVLVILITFGTQTLFTRAEISDFYATTCLGTWDNPSFAQGIPETFGTDVPLTTNVSATFTGATSQIFCGNFIPEEFKGEGAITNVGLTLVWSTEAALSEVPLMEEATTSENEVASSTSSGAFRFPIFDIVYAQEEVSPKPESAPTVAEPEPIAVEPESPISSDAPTSTVAEETTTPITQENAVSSSTEESVLSEEITASLPPPSPAFLRVSYSLDGTNWFALADVSEEMVPHLTVPLPLTAWEDLARVQIGIEGISAALPMLPKVLLDGMLLEVHYEIPPLITSDANQTENPVSASESATPVVPAAAIDVILREGEVPSFTADEAPSFELDLDALTPVQENEISPSSFRPPPPQVSLATRIMRWLGIGKFVHAQETETETPPLPTAANPVVAKVFSRGDEEADIRPQVLLANNRLRVNVPQPSDQFVPGKYSLRVWVWRNGVVYYTENEFTWGVLAMNPDKSVYLPGETSLIGIAVLDDGGNMVCDANVELSITTPAGEVRVLTTSGGNISVNPECRIKAYTEKPDYETSYAVEETGVYKTKLTATTANGAHTVYDSFEVRESVPFDVARVSATRIYPPVPYPVHITVGATEAFSGDVEERVPSSFQVKHISHGGVVVDRGGERIIRWVLTLAEGEKVTLSYDYLAPEISPQFYLLGPLRVGDFRETRRWQIAADAVASLSARTFYGATNNQGRLLWATGASNTTGGELLGPVGTASAVGFVKGAHAPTRDEIIAGVIKADGAVAISKIIGGQDAAGDAALQFDNAAVTTAQTCDATTFGSCWGAFDIAYEQLSGEAIVAFASTTAGRLAYRTWDGTSWSPATSSAPSTMSTGGSGAIRWVRLIPRGEMLKGSRSDEVLVITSDANSDIFAGIWNGSSWTATTSITATASTFQTQNFDGAWEETTGNALIVWSEGTTATTTPYRYKRWTRSTLSWDSTGTALPAIALSSIGHWMAAKAAPVSGKDHIAIIGNSATTVGNNCSTGTNCRIQPYIWTGGASPTMTIGNQWASSDPVWAQHANVGMESLNTNVQAFYIGSLSSASDASAWQTWIEGTGFSAITDIATNMGDDALAIQLTPHPNTNEIFATGRDSDSDCNGGAWGGGGFTGWDTTGCSSAGEDALAPLTISNGTVGEGRPFWVVAKPYSPWSRNWRFYGDIAENDPDNSSDALGVAENATPNVSLDDFVRLRFQFAELAGIAQTDARKKLQWTTDNPDIATSTWTDVGDTAESGAIWRYATAGETCANCSDNTAIGAQRLTGSTQSGTYLSDKDAAAGANMDHNALALVEYDYPLKAENATSGLTYYFRAYDNDQLTPVFREQDADGSNDCSDAVCGYPSIAVVEASNAAPTASAITLNGGSSITLIENTSTTIDLTGTATDVDGNADIAYATSVIYRSGVGASCTADQNSCYRIASTSCAKSNCSGNSCDFTCSAKIQYFADPTDVGSFSAQNWQGHMTVGDVIGDTGASSTASGVELNTLYALNVTGAISYGSLNPNTDTGAATQTTTVTNTGNAAIDVNLSGTSMANGGFTITADNQKYATSTFTYSSCTVCATLSGALTRLEIDLAKPTSETPVTDDVFWGLFVPSGKIPGSYTGSNTFEAIAD